MKRIGMVLILAWFFAPSLRASEMNMMEMFELCEPMAGEGSVVEILANTGGAVCAIPAAAVGVVISSPVALVKGPGVMAAGGVFGAVAGHRVGQYVIGLPVLLVKKVVWDTPKAVVAEFRSLRQP